MHPPPPRDTAGISGCADKGGILRGPDTEGGMTQEPEGNTLVRALRPSAAIRRERREDTVRGHHAMNGSSSAGDRKILGQSTGVILEEAVPPRSCTRTRSGESTDLRRHPRTLKQKARSSRWLKVGVRHGGLADPGAIITNMGRGRS